MLQSETYRNGNTLPCFPRLLAGVFLYPSLRVLGCIREIRVAYNLRVRAPMRSILVVRDSPDTAPLTAALHRLGHTIAGEVAEASVLSQSVAQLKPDVIVVSTETPGDRLFESLSSVAQSCPTTVVMFARDPSTTLIRKAVECGVSAYVVDGWAPERVTPIIEAAAARFEAYSAVKRELAQTRNKLSERKVIEKAKGIVMQQRGLTEDQAYSSLRKMAMDQSLPLAEIARRVITVAELLS